jgi:hypothetical protein
METHEEELTMRGISAILMMLGAFLLGAAAQPPPPAATDVVAIVQRHSSPLVFENGRISGAGADLLMRETANAQFVLLAEYVSHVDHATPEFMAGLFSALHSGHGFNYVAVEQDPFGMELASSDPVRGNIEAIAARARLYPYAFTFINDEELRMFAHVGRTSTGGWRPIWGFDQAFGAKLPLEELLALAPGKEAAAAVGEMLSEARRREVTVPDLGDWRGSRDFKTGHFIGSDTAQNLTRLARIRELYRPIIGSRTDELLRGLESSSLIYSYYHRSRERAPSGEPLGYFNNSVREQWMKDRFIDNYRLAEAADGKLPRVLIKAGTNHLIRGRNYTNIFSLGNMLHEFAITNRLRALTIAMLPVREGWPSFDKVPSELQPLLPSRDLSGTTLVDLRPLRAHLHGGNKFGLDGEALTDFRNFVHGLDFALFLPSGPGTFKLTAPSRPPEGKRRKAGN